MYYSSEKKEWLNFLYRPPKVLPKNITIGRSVFYGKIFILKLQYQFVHFFATLSKNIGTSPKIYVKTRLCLFILVLTSILGLVN